MTFDRPLVGLATVSTVSTRTKHQAPGTKHQLSPVTARIVPKEFPNRNPIRHTVPKRCKKKKRSNRWNVSEGEKRSDGQNVSDDADRAQITNARTCASCFSILPYDAALCQSALKASASRLYLQFAQSGRGRTPGVPPLVARAFLPTAIAPELFGAFTEVPRSLPSDKPRSQSADTPYTMHS